MICDLWPMLHDLRSMTYDLYWVTYGLWFMIYSLALVMYRFWINICWYNIYYILNFLEVVCPQIFFLHFPFLSQYFPKYILIGFPSIGCSQLFFSKYVGWISKLYCSKLSFNFSPNIYWLDPLLCPAGWSVELGRSWVARRPSSMTVGDTLQYCQLREGPAWAQCM